MTDDEELSEAENLDMEDEDDLLSMTQSAGNLASQSTAFTHQVSTLERHYDTRLPTPGDEVDDEDDDDDFMSSGCVNPNDIFVVQDPPLPQLDGTNDTRLSRYSVISYSENVLREEDRSLDPASSLSPTSYALNEPVSLPEDTVCEASSAGFSSSHTPASSSSVSSPLQLDIGTGSTAGTSSEDSRTSEFVLSDRSPCFSGTEDTKGVTPLPSTSGGGECLPSTSRKGYQHRHTRRYGLSGEEKKKRFAELNNEASLIYRENKRTRDKESKVRLEDLVAANERELQRYRLLRQHVRFSREFHSEFAEFFPEAPEPVSDTDDED